MLPTVGKFYLDEAKLGAFSAASAPIFASKHSLLGMSRYLQTYLADFTAR